MLRTVLIVLALVAQPTFRSNAVLVSVDVSVESSGRSAAGLHLTDFELSDNGRIQELQSVAIEAMPVDLTLVIDRSPSMSTWRGQLATHLREIAERLSAHDRVRLICFGSDVSEAMPWTGARDAMMVRLAPLRGATALHDALAAGMAHSPDVHRKHLVIAFTDGIDNASVLAAEQVMKFALRSDVSLSVLLHLPGIGLTYPSSWSGSNPHMLESIAESTGGRVERTISGRPSSLVARVLADYASRYVLRYSPSDASPGWHTVRVRVPGVPAAVIRHRQGYSLSK